MKNNNKPREVYYDVQMVNYESIGTEARLLNFSETRNKPLIENCKDYSMSIVRFEIDTYHTLPTFTADIMPDQSNYNRMIESVTFSYKNSRIGPYYLTWVPTNTSTSKPPVTPTIQNSTSEYYWGYSFQEYCDLVNEVFRLLTIDLKIAAGADLVNLVPPKLIWNNQNETAELLTQRDLFDRNLTDHVSIFFNRALHAKLNSFQAIRNLTAPFQKIFELVIRNYNESNVVWLSPTTDMTSAVAYIKTKQQFSTISNLCGVSSIVFTSNTIPIVPTQVSDPLVFYHGDLLNKSTLQNQVNVISDMSTLDMCYQSTLMYSPSAEYRFIDMFGNNNLHNIDINVWWKDKLGNLKPFYLASGASASIKILFKLKE